MTDPLSGQEPEPWATRREERHAPVAPDAQVWDTTHRCHRQSMIDPQRSDAAPPQALVVTELMVTGMCCQSEVALIRKKIGMLDGVVDLKFNLMLRRCTVTHTEDLTAVQLLRPLNWAALGATVLPPKGAGGAGIQRGALCRPGLLVALLSLLLFGLSNGIWARPDGTEWWEDPFSYFALSNVCAHRRRPQSAAAQSTETHGNLSSTALRCCLACRSCSGAPSPASCRGGSACLRRWRSRASARLCCSTSGKRARSSSSTM